MADRKELLLNQVVAASDAAELELVKAKLQVLEEHTQEVEQ